MAPRFSAPKRAAISQLPLGKGGEAKDGIGAFDGNLSKICDNLTLKIHGRIEVLLHISAGTR